MFPNSPQVFRIKGEIVSYKNTYVLQISQVVCPFLHIMNFPVLGTVRQTGHKTCSSRFFRISFSASAFSFNASNSSQLVPNSNGNTLALSSSSLCWLFILGLNLGLNKEYRILNLRVRLTGSFSKIRYCYFDFQFNEMVILINFTVLLLTCQQEEPIQK